MTDATAVFVSPMLVSRGPLPRGAGWAYEVIHEGTGQVKGDVTGPAHSGA